MTLLTQEILRNIPALYSQENVEDPTVWVKYFTPDSGWSWLATEYDPEERLFFGFVVSGLDPSFHDLCFWTLDDLETSRGSLGHPIERDSSWTPRILSEAKASVRSVVS